MTEKILGFSGEKRDILRGKDILGKAKDILDKNDKEDGISAQNRPFNGTE